jgi:hypothetical protein
MLQITLLSCYTNRLNILDNTEFLSFQDILNFHKFFCLVLIIIYDLN